MKPRQIIAVAALVSPYVITLAYMVPKYRAHRKRQARQQLLIDANRYALNVVLKRVADGMYRNPSANINDDFEIAKMEFLLSK